MISFHRTVQVYCGILILNVFLAATLVSGACDSPWLQLDDTCYYVSPNDNSGQVESWHESQNWCLQNGGYLASIEDIDERQLITNLTQLGSYNGAMWIGLNKLDDRINYQWVDGSTSGFRDWAEGEPNSASNGMCVFQLTHPEQDCSFTHDPGFNTINGLFDAPYNANPPHTFYFGYLAGQDDNTGSANCQSRCSAEPPCYSYTFISNGCPNVTWKGECMGRSNEYEVSDPYEYAISGNRLNCGETGLWYVGNCGEKRGFICKKAVDDTSTPNPTTPPTPTVPGFCPAGYIDGGGNKCFKIVHNPPADGGVSWDDALTLCRAEPGIAPDLASILSEYENAAITMYLRDEYWGFWIGLRQSYSNQWVWTDNQDVTYLNWASGEPSDSAKCTELWTNPGPAGTWNNLDCSQGRGYICQIYKDANSIIVTPPSTPAHSCQTDYYNYGGICYRKITSGSSWFSALATCQADGATLATIHSEAENSALYVFASDIAPFWIGYHKNENDEWVWTDGWPNIYSNWNAGEDPGTGGGCASFKDNGNWKDDQCNNTLTAVCMISTATVPTTPASVEGICPSDWLDYGSSCYYFSQYNENLNWEMAEQSCNSKAGLYTVGSLVSIHSAVENQFIYEQLKVLGSGDVWIGLHQETLGSPHEWSDGTGLQYTRWAPGEPSHENGTQQCVEMYVTMWPGMWNDHQCYESRQYVCKAPKVNPTAPTIPPGPPCPKECGWETYGTNCFYMKLTQDLTFNEARDACVSLAGSAADLVTIPDANTNLFLMKMVLQQSPSWVPIWIGLTRPDSETEFRWVDNTELNFTNWAPGEPNNGGDEYCGEMLNDNGEWNDVHCETIRNAYICQVERGNLILQRVPRAMSIEPESSDSGIYLTSGELAGVILGTMFGTILMVGVGMVMYSVVRRKSRPSAPKQLGSLETHDGPYSKFEEQLSRSSSIRSSSHADKKSEFEA